MKADLMYLKEERVLASGEKDPQDCPLAWGFLGAGTPLERSIAHFEGIRFLVGFLIPVVKK